MTNCCKNCDYQRTVNTLLFHEGKMNRNEIYCIKVNQAMKPLLISDEMNCATFAPKQNRLPKVCNCEVCGEFHKQNEVRRVFKDGKTKIFICDNCYDDYAETL